MTKFFKNVNDKHDRDENGHIKSYIYLDEDNDIVKGKQSCTQN